MSIETVPPHVLPGRGRRGLLSLAVKWHSQLLASPASRDNAMSSTPKKQATEVVLEMDSISNVPDALDQGHSYLTGWRLKLVIITLALGMFLVGVDSSIIGVVTPSITTTFHSMDDISWYGSGYMLPHTVLQPTLGTFYKSCNVTYVYFISIFIFEGKLSFRSVHLSITLCIANRMETVGSCLCAAAPNSTIFIVGRVIAGCGGAGILQGTLSIVGYSVPKKKVPIYYGYVLSVQAISACSAPIFGGIFADKISWRWCFWM